MRGNKEIHSAIAQKPRSYARFVLRCVHSLSGIVFTLFLCEHIFTNMLASSYFLEGSGFVQLVSSFHRIPGLKAIEIVCLALPFLCHAILGIPYLFQACPNAGISWEVSLRYYTLGILRILGKGEQHGFYFLD